MIFILTDDQGWQDAAFAGHPYVKTPHLDALAAQSTWFRQFYVAATVCSPSRTAFMTAHYPARHLVHGHFATHQQNLARSMPDWLAPETPTLASILKSAGYATAHIGKWHLGSGAEAPTPEAYGFDFVRHTTGNHPYWEEQNSDPYFRARSTQLFVDEAIQFIRQNRDRPFYLNLWTLLPHALLKPTPEQLEPYTNLQPSANAGAFGPWMRKYLENAKELTSQMQVFCASLTDLDTQLGRLFQTLAELSLADDTIVVFSSDNGPEDYRIGNAANAGVGSTGSLRGRKRSMYEGGIRTFGLVRWPGHVPAGRRDETSVVAAVDLLPTICKLTGTVVPSSVAPDGEDVSDIWMGDVRPRRKPLYWEWLFNVQGKDDGYMPSMLATRQGDWKLFVNHDGSQVQLFDVVADPGELHDVSQQNPAVVFSLKEDVLSWVQSLPDSPARQAVLETGRPVDSRAAQTTNQSEASGSIPNSRQEIFQRKDSNQDKHLTLAEFLDRFPDQDEGRLRFSRFDVDGDNVLSLEEFVKAGKQ